MDVSALANNVNPNNATTSVNAMKKAMDVEQNTTLKVLEDTMQQQQQLQQAVAQKTGVGANLNITA